MTTAPIHILKKLRLPARYEQLSAVLGSDVVKLLTPPEANLTAVSRIALASGQSGEGAFVPCYGDTGAGKTTFAETIGYFLPEKFTRTLTHSGAITHEDLSSSVSKHLQKYAPSDKQLVPINIDHREGAPPTDEELAALKRFLRTSSRPCIAFWLETDLDRAVEITDRYIKITGQPPSPLPLLVDGPPRATWHSVALNTIQLCNSLTGSELIDLGIDPQRYDLSRFRTLGEYFRQLSVDFTNVLASHEESTKRQVTLLICYISEALERGCLPSFTSKGGEAGLIDSSSLLNCTPESMIGKKWEQKRGILTQAIFRLDARAFWLPPAAVISILRRSGPPEVQKILEKLGRNNPSPADIHTYLGRTDLGRYLAGVKGASYETRGRPAEDARDALRKISAEYGYSGGRDKLLNRSLLEWLSTYAKDISLNIASAGAETALPFCPGLIPDNFLDIGERVLSIEYMWRSGDALDSSRRSEVAQYALEKLHNYAVNLGWTVA